MYPSTHEYTLFRQNSWGARILETHASSLPSLFRSSITRISLEDKDLRSKEVSKQERDILVLNKAGIVTETIQESANANRGGSDSDSDTGKALLGDNRITGRPTGRLSYSLGEVPTNIRGRN